MLWEEASKHKSSTSEARVPQHSNGLRSALARLYQRECGLRDGWGKKESDLSVTYGEWHALTCNKASRSLLYIFLRKCVVISGTRDLLSSECHAWHDDIRCHLC